MKKKTIALQLRKSKIANFHNIYGGATSPCNSASQGTTDSDPDPEPPKSTDKDFCSGSGRNESLDATDILC